MSKKFEEYRSVAETRALMSAYRQEEQLSCDEIAKLIAEETGYHFTGPKYFAIEKGVTKDIPLWVVVAFMRVLHMDSADRLFPYVGMF